jgi:hypothetical protein
LLRKPKGIGCEIKSACDASSQILLMLEIVEGKYAKSTKRYEESFKYSNA